MSDKFRKFVQQIRVDDPTEDVTVSGELNITITYQFEANRDLSKAEKLQLMEEAEKELVQKIRLLDNVKKCEV